MGFRPVYAVLVIALCAYISSGEEEEENADSYHGLMQCKVCEDTVKTLIERIKKTPMGETVKSRRTGKSDAATKLARAHEIVDGLCDGERTYTKTYCEQTVEMLEEPFIALALGTRPYTTVEEAQEVCLPLCDLKREIRKKTKSMEETIRQMRERSIFSEMVDVFKENWVLIVSFMVGSVTIAVYVQYRLMLRYGRKLREAKKRQMLAAANAAQVQRAPLRAESTN